MLIWLNSVVTFEPTAVMIRLVSSPNSIGLDYDSEFWRSYLYRKWIDCMHDCVHNWINMIKGVQVDFKWKLLVN